MSDNEFMSIKDGVNDLKNDFKEVMKVITDMRLDIATNYVKKEDNDKAHWKFTGWIIGLFVFIISIAGAVISILKM